MNENDVHHDYFSSVEKKYSADIIAEARQHIDNLDRKRSREFWQKHPDTKYYMTRIPTLRDLKVPEHMAKTYFLTRLLCPISPSNAPLRQVGKQWLKQLESLEQPLMPIESKAGTFIETFRVLLTDENTKEELADQLQKEDDELLNDQEVNWTAPMDNSLRSIILRCAGCIYEVPAKEEVMYLIAALAMFLPDCLPNASGIILDRVLTTFVSTFAQIDEYIGARRNARDKYELALMTARFRADTITRLLPPVFSYKRYKHTGSWAGHRMRSLSLFTSAIIMHFWRRTDLVLVLIMHCIESKQVSRLHLLKLLQIVLHVWPVSDAKSLVKVIKKEIKNLWNKKTESGELKKNGELIDACFKRFCSLKARCKIKRHIRSSGADSVVSIKVK